MHFFNMGSQQVVVLVFLLHVFAGEILCNTPFDVQDSIEILQPDTIKKWANSKDLSLVLFFSEGE